MKRSLVALFSFAGSLLIGCAGAQTGFSLVGPKSTAGVDGSTTHQVHVDWQGPPTVRMVASSMLNPDGTTQLKGRLRSDAQSYLAGARVMSVEVVAADGTVRWAGHALVVAELPAHRAGTSDTAGGRRGSRGSRRMTTCACASATERSASGIGARAHFREPRGQVR